MYTLMQVPLEAKDVEPSAAGVTDGGELPNMGTRNQLQVLYKSSMDS